VSKKLHITCKINGQETELLCEARQSLLEVLRDELKLTGAKEGCNNGNCGACNVIFDGRLVNSCLVMAPEVQGHTVTTIEGIATKDGLHPIQKYFLEGAALQCGICTPGFIVAAKALLDKNPPNTTPATTSPATCAAAPDTTKSSARCWKQRRAGRRSEQSIVS
jgi:carbon-monoxide dehydrogenase small subunit